MPEADLSSLPTWLEWSRRATAWPSCSARRPTRCRSISRQLESVQCEGYRRDAIVFDVEDTMSVPAYLLVLLDGRAEAGAAVLACHGCTAPASPRPSA